MLAVSSEEVLASATSRQASGGFVYWLAFTGVKRERLRQAFRPASAVVLGLRGSLLTPSQPPNEPHLATATATP